MSEQAQTRRDGEGSGSSEPLLRATDLHKAFRVGARAIEVLRGVALEVRAGESVAIVGASGAGKSTLLNTLAGLEPPNSGAVWMEGRPVYRLGRATRARLRAERIGFVFQAYPLLPELDALENVMVPALLARRSWREARERAAHLLGRVGLGDRAAHRPHELSGGEQQRVAIARALVNHPALLLADEPTGNLDSATGAQILDVLCQAGSESGTTLLLVTHEAGAAQRFARVIEMADGRLWEGPGAAVGAAAADDDGEAQRTGGGRG